MMSNINVPARTVLREVHVFLDPAKPLQIRQAQRGD